MSNINNEELINTDSSENKEASLGSKHFEIIVDGQIVVLNKQKVTGQEILEAACRTPVLCYTLYQKFKDCDFDKVELSDVVDLKKTGLEHFVSKPPDTFHYSLDDDPEITDLKIMTPNQILLNGLIDPKTHYLVQIHDDGSQTSYKDMGEEPVRMKCPHMTFVSILNGPTPVS